MTDFHQEVSDNVVLAQVVISPTGHAVAKRYAGKNLQPGDIGLHVRIDRGNTKGELTPAQAIAAQMLAQDMARFFLAQNNVEPAGFSPGDIIKLENGTLYMVNQDSGAILRVQKLNGQGELVRCTLHSQDVEEVPTKRKGLVALLLESGGLLPNFTKLSMDPELVLLAMSKYTGDDRGKDEFILTLAILASETPIDHFAALKLVAEMGRDEAQSYLKDFLLKSSDSRCAELYAELIIHDGSITELEMDLSGRKELLEAIVTKIDPYDEHSGLIIQAAQQHGQPFEGRAKALFQALSVFIERGRFDLFLATCEMLVEDGVELEVPALGKPDSAGMGNCWRIEASIEGEPISLEGLLSERAVWHKHQLEDLLSLCNVIKAPEGFWREVKRGFDGKRSYTPHFLECRNKLRNACEKLAFLQWAVRTGMFQNGPSYVECVQELFLAVMDNDGEEEAKEVVQLQAVKLIEPLRLEPTEAILGACLLSVRHHAIRALLSRGDFLLLRIKWASCMEIIAACDDPEWLIMNYNHYRDGNMSDGLRTTILARLKELGVSKERLDEAFND